MNQIIMNKKVKAFQVNNKGKTILLDPIDRALMITDIVISKGREGRTVLRITDEDQSTPILFVDKAGTQSINIPTGLIYWRGAKLEMENDEDGTTVITIGYLVVDNAKDRSVFNL